MSMNWEADNESSPETWKFPTPSRTAARIESRLLSRVGFGAAVVVDVELCTI